MPLQGSRGRSEVSKKGKSDGGIATTVVESNAELNVESNAESKVKSKVKELVRTGCSRTSS
jgi:hypothetical protein